MPNRINPFDSQPGVCLGLILHYDKISVLGRRRYQQFCTILRAEAPKTGKKLKVEDPIPNKYELRLLVIRPGRHE
jgi:hypothetical protein